MYIEKENIFKIKWLISESEKILLVAHKNPDWDTIGSTTALYEYLKNIWKKPVLVCESDIPFNLQFIPNSEFFKKDFDLKDFDLIIICDAWAKNVAWFLNTHPELYEKILPTINLDHHKKNDMYWTINIVDIKYPSTTCLIFDIFKILDIEINKNIATSLLTWIYTDTGSFMHSNTNSYPLNIASVLLKKWANIRLIYKNIFKTIKISTMNLWWKVFDNIFKNKDWVVFSILKEKDFTETDSNYEELTWVIDYVNSIPDSKFSLLLTERDWKVKWSLRTLQDDIDLTEIAWRFGWWWHKKASWFSIWWKIVKEVSWKIVN